MGSCTDKIYGPGGNLKQLKDLLEEIDSELSEYVTGRTEYEDGLIVGLNICKFKIEQLLRMSSGKKKSTKP